MTVSYLKDFNDDAYDDNDGTEEVSFRCRHCYGFTDIIVRAGILTDDLCSHCGERI